MLTGQEIPRYTIDDYQHWKDDWEIINGYPYAMKPSPFFRHQKISLKLAKLLSNAMDKCSTCECDVVYEIDWIINDDTIVRPDIMIVCDQKNKDDFVRTAPVLIIEVLSDRTKLKDRNVKYNLYQNCGTRYYLMVDLEARRIEYFELENKAFLQKDIIKSFYLQEGTAIEADLSKVFN